MNNTLAIVIPAYKATFFRETLESIAAQTDKRFTLYIGDDCSPHDLKTIVDDFHDKIDIVYHRFEENLGGKDLVAHWQRCIDLSDGEEYLWLFSDDDLMDAHCVEAFLSLSDDIKSNSLIHFDIKLKDDLSDGVSKVLPPFPTKINARDYLIGKLRGSIVSFVIEFIFSRKLYEEVGGFQSFDLAWGSDFMTWLKMAANCKNGIITIKKTNTYVKWRKSAENITPNKTKPILKRKLNSLIENAVFIKYQLEQSPEKFKPLHSQFRFVRFPLAELLRNKENLSYLDITRFCMIYIHKVGYPFLVLLTLLKIISQKSFKL